MISTTDKPNYPLRKVYAFYSVIIVLCILALFLFNLNIFSKMILCTLIFLCLCIIRSISKGVMLTPNVTPHTLQEEIKDVENMEVIEDTTVPKISKCGAIDTYLTLLIETDEELSNDPSVDKSSSSYNNLLNHRIAMKLDAMSQNNPSLDKL